MVNVNNRIKELEAQVAENKRRCDERNGNFWAVFCFVMGLIIIFVFIRGIAISADNKTQSMYCNDKYGPESFYHMQRSLPSNVWSCDVISSENVIVQHYVTTKMYDSAYQCDSIGFFDLTKWGNDCKFIDSSSQNDRIK